jgi:ABC-2 type transport system permease protein
MRRILRAYPTLLAIGLKEAIAYRAEFVVWMLTMTMPLVMLAITSAMAREGAVGRFDPDAFTAYYLATLIVRQMSGSWVVWEMIREIKEGTLSLRLVRPMHPLVGYSAESLAAIPMRALVSLPLAAIALAVVGAERLTHDWVVLLCFGASIVGAFVLNFAVSATVGVLGLFLESSIAIWELWLGGFMIFSGYLLPLELFPPWLERLARLLPFPYLQAVPVEILTGVHGRASALRALGWQWGYATVAVLLLLSLWKRGIRRFQAYGG